MLYISTQYVWEKCIVHTSDFEYLEIYKNYSEWYTEIKVLGKIEE